MSNSVNYDCAIIGGGVAGLCLSIQLARLGYSIIVFEKNSYPFHKVCGEYVSNESYPFFLRLGLPLDEWNLPRIQNIGISSEKGFQLNAPLKMGGFGISRFKLDYELLILAQAAGVTVKSNTRVNNIDNGIVQCNSGQFQSRLIVGAFGKSSPLFTEAIHKHADQNYIGVKYHLRTTFPNNRIELHNFTKGYCGISKIEGEHYCLCYLSHASNLKASNNSIKEMEETVLKKNPLLRSIFNNSDFSFQRPVTISNIKFEARKTADAKMLYLGDAAGCISPLTGNGMSMAAYTSVLLTDLIDEYLKNKLTKQQLQNNYQTLWNQHFLKRIERGKKLQYLFGKRNWSDLVLRLLNPLGYLKTHLIESTHGEQF